jgi:hypothetical protein
VPTAEDVPFWTAVYSGYTTYFGSRFSVSSRFCDAVDFERTYPLMAREFIWGFVNCWSDDWRGAKGVDGRKCDAALAFARARQDMMDFLALGTLEGQLNTEEPLPSVPYTVWSAMHSRKNAASAHMHAVIGAWWQDVSRRRLALVGVNVSGEEQTFRFRLPDGCDTLSPHPLSMQEPPTLAEVQAGVTTATVGPRTIFCLIANHKGKE